MTPISDATPDKQCLLGGTVRQVCLLRQRFNYDFGIPKALRLGETHAGSGSAEGDDGIIVPGSPIVIAREVIRSQREIVPATGLPAPFEASMLLIERERKSCALLSEELAQMDTKGVDYEIVRADNVDVIPDFPLLFKDALGLVSCDPCGAPPWEPLAIAMRDPRMAGMMVMVRWPHLVHSLRSIGKRGKVFPFIDEIIDMSGRDVAMIRISDSSKTWANLLLANMSCVDYTFLAAIEAMGFYDVNSVIGRIHMETILGSQNNTLKRHDSKVKASEHAAPVKRRRGKAKVAATTKSFTQKDMFSAYVQLRKKVDACEIAKGFGVEEAAVANLINRESFKRSYAGILASATKRRNKAEAGNSAGSVAVVAGEESTVGTADNPVRAGVSGRRKPYGLEVSDDIDTIDTDVAEAVLVEHRWTELINRYPRAIGREYAGNRGLPAERVLWVEDLLRETVGNVVLTKDVTGHTNPVLAIYRNMYRGPNIHDKEATPTNRRPLSRQPLTRADIDVILAVFETPRGSQSKAEELLPQYSKATIARVISRTHKLMLHDKVGKTGGTDGKGLEGASASV